MRYGGSPCSRLLCQDLHLRPRAPRRRLRLWCVPSVRCVLFAMLAPLAALPAAHAVDIRGPGQRRGQHVGLGRRLCGAAGGRAAVAGGLARLTLVCFAFLQRCITLPTARGWSAATAALRNRGHRPPVGSTPPTPNNACTARPAASQALGATHVSLQTAPSRGPPLPPQGRLFKLKLEHCVMEGDGAGMKPGMGGGAGAMGPAADLQVPASRIHGWCLNSNSAAPCPAVCQGCAKASGALRLQPLAPEPGVAPRPPLAGNCQFRAISFGLYGAPAGGAAEWRGCGSAALPLPALGSASCCVVLRPAASRCALLCFCALRPSLSVAVATAAGRAHAHRSLCCRSEAWRPKLAQAPSVSLPGLAQQWENAQGLCLPACAPAHPRTCRLSRPCRHAAAPRLCAAAGGGVHAAAPDGLPGISGRGVGRLPQASCLQQPRQLGGSLPAAGALPHAFGRDGAAC